MNALTCSEIIKKNCFEFMNEKKKFSKLLILYFWIHLINIEILTF